MQKIAEVFELFVPRIKYKAVHSVNTCYSVIWPVRTDLLIQQFETETLRYTSSYHVRPVVLKIFSLYLFDVFKRIYSPA